MIGWLLEVPRPELVIAAFMRGMAELGYVEGKKTSRPSTGSIRTRYRKPADLVRLNVNVIFAAAPAALAAASNATASTPVVGLDLESHPVAKRYGKSLARPGGNVAGIFLDIPELSGKQLGLLKEIVPHLSRVAIFGIPGLNAPQFRAMETAARAFNVEAEIMDVQILDDFGGAMEAAGA
jgi:ABC-type uncharacterized transport system substrate-binding protein